MADRYVVSVVDPTNHVRQQTPAPFLPRARVGDAVNVALKALDQLPGQGAGWVVTITKQESVLNMHLNEAEIAQYGDQRKAG